MINYKAIFQLYPEVVSVRHNVAYDKLDNVVEYDLAAVEELSGKINCSDRAKSLLSLTDWAVLPDVNLANADEFTAYRSQLRNLIINPVVDPQWPEKPTAVWK